jgi:hypothetical protein
MKKKRRFQKNATLLVWGEAGLALGSPRAKPLLEAIYATTGIENLLLAGEEGVALRTDINVNVLTQGGTGLDDVATATGSGHVTVLGMDIIFHSLLLGISTPPPGLWPGTASRSGRWPQSGTGQKIGGHLTRHSVRRKRYNSLSPGPEHQPGRHLLH